MKIKQKLLQLEDQGSLCLSRIIIQWNIEWKNNVRKGNFKILYSTNKYTPLNDMNIKILNVSDEMHKKNNYELKINNVRVGTKYYTRIILVQDNERKIQTEEEQNRHLFTKSRLLTESQPSELSDGVEIPCPDGGYCGDSDGDGVYLNETQNLNGYFRTKDNTFLLCEFEVNCPGVILNGNGVVHQSNVTLKNGCPVGYRGMMCLKCEERFTRQGELCNECGDISLQILYMTFLFIAGVIVFSYLIYKQIKKSEESPQTEYLFAGLHDQNKVQKSFFPKRVQRRELKFTRSK